MKTLFYIISKKIAKNLNIDTNLLFNKFIKREKEASTIIDRGIAIPHIFVDIKNFYRLILVRAKNGIIFPDSNFVYTTFIIVGSSDQRMLHLKILASIAKIAKTESFQKEWIKAKSIEDLKHAILLVENR